jgi:hypothetical protein
VKPLLAALAVVAAGLVLVFVGEWRLGAAVVGLALSLAGAVRLTLPAHRAGDLAVRSRVVDATVLVVLGLALVALANSIPGH